LGIDLALSILTRGPDLVTEQGNSDEGRAESQEADNKRQPLLEGERKFWPTDDSD
jgi:hypothetical protein